MKRYLMVGFSLFFLVTLLLLPTAAESAPASSDADVVAMVDEIFSSAKDALQSLEQPIYEAFDDRRIYNFDPADAYYFYWFDSDVFDKRYQNGYKKGDSLEYWLDMGDPQILLPSSDGVARVIEYRNIDGNWEKYASYGAWFDGSSKNSYLLSKEQVLSAVQSYDFGKIQDIRLVVTTLGCMTSLIYVKSDTGEYVIPYGIRDKIGMTDGEVYTVEELAHHAYWNWYGCTYYCMHCGRSGVNWLQLHWPYLLSWTIPPICLAAFVLILLVRRHKKEKGRQANGESSELVSADTADEAKA